MISIISTITPRKCQTQLKKLTFPWVVWQRVAWWRQGTRFDTGSRRRWSRWCSGSSRQRSTLSSASAMRSPPLMSRASHTVYIDHHDNTFSVLGNDIISVNRWGVSW